MTWHYVSTLWLPEHAQEVEENRLLSAVFHVWSLFNHRHRSFRSICFYIFFFGIFPFLALCVCVCVRTARLLTYLYLTHTAIFDGFGAVIILWMGLLNDNKNGNKSLQAAEKHLFWFEICSFILLKVNRRNLHLPIHFWQTETAMQRQRQCRQSTLPPSPPKKRKKQNDQIRDLLNLIRQMNINISLLFFSEKLCAWPRNCLGSVSLELLIRHSHVLCSNSRRLFSVVQANVADFIRNCVLIKTIYCMLAFGFLPALTHAHLITWY